MSAAERYLRDLMRTVVILQARTSSKRLPGKALLPVAGYPSSVLAALRAANDGHEVLVATSWDSSDDELAQALSHQRCKAFRGPLENVLERFYLATRELSSDCLIVRLTGDNLLPDGSFIAELLSAFNQSGVEYLSAGSPETRLPYGLSGEAFTVATLRKAHFAATSDYDREHVGPWMIRNCRVKSYSPSSLESDFSHLRCTIDDEEDYQRMTHLFADVADPLSTSWMDLVHKLSSLPGEPEFRVPFRLIEGRLHSTMTLGTVQLGMNYGIVNRTGKPRRDNAIAIIRHAIAHGVTALDTARSYGDSEEAIGQALAGAWFSRASVVTKLDTLESLPSDATASQVRDAVNRSVHASCDALHTTHLPTLLLHRWQHHDSWSGAAWQQLISLRDAGVIGKLGASVYDPSEVLAAIQDPDVHHIQLPFNVLDSRWKNQGVDRELTGRRDLIVHARSVFLQGVLLHSAEQWPMTENFDVLSCIARLRDLARKFGRQNVADLCLAYVRSQPWVTSLVVGCETKSQLEQNLQLFRTSALTLEQCEELENSIATAPPQLLNPSKWNLANA